MFAAEKERNQSTTKEEQNLKRTNKNKKQSIKSKRTPSLQ